jgi:hypothetical protein
MQGDRFHAYGGDVSAGAGSSAVLLCVPVEQHLPLEAHAEHASLWTCDDDGRWSEFAVFRFGPAE